MKIIKESKENLPIDFITQFVSRSWEEVGNIKASIDGISKAFKNTKNVENVLQDLVDAYLITIGQLESYLDKKDYIDLPSDEKILKEDLNEDVLVDIQLKDEDSVDKEDLEVNTQELLTDMATISDDVEKKVIVRDVEEIIDPTEEKDEVAKDASKSPEAFEYFADFDDPAIDVDEQSDRKEWLNRQAF